MTHFEESSLASRLTSRQQQLPPSCAPPAVQSPGNIVLYKLLLKTTRAQEVSKARPDLPGVAASGRRGDAAAAPTRWDQFLFTPQAAVADAV